MPRSCSSANASVPSPFLGSSLSRPCRRPSFFSQLASSTFRSASSHSPSSSVDWSVTRFTSRWPRWPKNSWEVSWARSSARPGRSRYRSYCWWQSASCRSSTGVGSWTAHRRPEQVTPSPRLGCRSLTSRIVGQREVVLILLDGVQLQDGVQSVEQAADLVGDFDVGPAHRGHRVISTEEAPKSGIELLFLGFLVRLHLVDQHPVHAPHMGQGCFGIERAEGIGNLAE